jgi:PPM family protein phosphatase
MNVYHHTEVGNHPSNEDAIGFVRRGDETDALICALSDGQGGQPGGAPAAQHAVTACLEFAQARPGRELLDPFGWVSVGESVDRSVMRLPEAGFATLVGAAVTSEFVAGASCGDSAAGLLLGDKFVLLTERQQKNPPVGSGAARFTPFSARLFAPWKLLFMSDGVWKYAGWDGIIRLCRSVGGQGLVSSLRDMAADATRGRLMDDFSVVLIEP